MANLNIKKYIYIIFYLDFFLVYSTKIKAKILILTNIVIIIKAKNTGILILISLKKLINFLSLFNLAIFYKNFF